jgi:hypothetical protein
MIDRPLRVLRRLGQAVHAQAGVALFDQHLPGDTQERRLPLPDLALFSSERSHIKIIDGPSEKVESSICSSPWARHMSRWDVVARVEFEYVATPIARSLLVCHRYEKILDVFEYESQARLLHNENDHAAEHDVRKTWSGRFHRHGATPA